MNVLIVYAHPEPKSLNGYLKDFSKAQLEKSGHEVIVSDLYEMEWKAVADGNDFLNYTSSKRLRYMESSRIAYKTNLQSEDITSEQSKILWADLIIFQFPFWWFGMPAILKGWIDRVYAFGFAYGTGRYGGKYWGNRYGDGTLKGKKAMLSITIGGRKPQYEERGVNGNIDDLLFPIHHGMLWYTGISVIPPQVIYQADSLVEENLEIYLEKLKKTLDSIESIEPIPYRYQNYGDYDDHQQLNIELAQERSGFSLHLK